MANIISVSRRTDIPLYYSKWFVERLRAGYVDLRNPFNQRPLRISLKREDITGFVFWSKNFKPLLKYLNEIEEYSRNFHFHFTINLHSKEVEPADLNFNELIRTFEFLGKRYGENSLSWRFDPILPSSIFPYEEQLKNFKKIGNALKGMTKRCITSFMFPYGKVKKRFEKKFILLEESFEERKEILKILLEETSKWNMDLFLCSSEPRIEGIGESKCIDSFSFFGIEGKKTPTRKGCNCDFSLDIGTYSTCKSKCLYCYAS